MILKAIFMIISGVLSLIPFNLPSLPGKFDSLLDTIFNGITNSLSYINFFIDLKFWIACAVAITIVYNIKHVWNFFVFCLNIIPTVNISYWH